MADPLTHVPGSSGLPGVGHTITFLRDARGLLEDQRKRYGDVFRLNILGRQNVIFLSPQATKEIYLDPGGLLSSEQGWESSIGPMFRRGLMLRDFDDHHLHRRVMQQAFSRAALDSYVPQIHRVIDRTLDRLRPGPVEMYQLMKRLNLDIATEVFIGANLAEAEAMNAAFVAMMRASVTPIRLDVPGLAYRRGLAGRERLKTLFTELVTDRRSRPVTPDLLSRLSHASTESGAPLPVDEVVDHMIFILLAAHDTTTATLSVLLWQLALHPEWQAAVTDEVRALGGGEVTMANHASLEVLGTTLNEALRLSPPVPVSPRVAVRATTIGGVSIPAGTAVAAASLALHRHPDWWTEPDRFDPERFNPERAEHRQHSHLFVPFGGGAHLCIGNHLAEIVTKAVVARLLVRYRLTADPTRPVEIQAVPIPRPKRGLELTLAGRSEGVPFKHSGGQADTTK